MRDRTSEGSERHARLKELFFQAIELEEEARGRFLDDVCRTDAQLRAELESLLKYHRRSDLTEDAGGDEG